MSYNQRYYFTFYADRDTRIIDGTPDNYTCNISQLDYGGAIAGNTGSGESNSD
jgi:hypothetical protein